MPWTRTAHDRDEVTLRSVPHGQQGYPFAVQVDATYRLDAQSGLHVTVTAVNKGSRPAPWGDGHHPYLTVATPVVDDCELTLPAGHWLPADERGIPSGAPEDVAGTDFDFRDRAQARRHPARPRVHRPAQGGGRPGLGPAVGGRRDHRAVGGRGLPLAAGLHRRHARAGAPQDRAGRGADDLPAERVRHRRGPAGAAAKGNRQLPVGHQELFFRTYRSDSTDPRQVFRRCRRRRGCPCRRTPLSVTSPGRARRNARAPVSPVASSITAGQCPRAISTGLRGLPS